MNAETSEALIKSINPGDCIDLYYPGDSNTQLQCFPSYVENRYAAGLPSLTFGSSSTVLFNPSEGLGDIVLSVTLPAGSGAGSYVNASLPSGWGYNLIENIQLRIAGSSQYQFTGDQLFVAVMSECESQQKADDVINQGGNALTNAQLQNAATAETLRTAHIYLKCPWNTISEQEKTTPLPTDLLSQPVQFVVKLRDAASFFVPWAAGAVGVVPTALASGEMTFRQVHLMNAQNLLARRKDMNSEALSLPLRYFQNTTFRTNATLAAGGTADLNLTGFRSGSLGSIDFWIVRASDYAAGKQFNFVEPKNVNLKINGLVYYNSSKGSSRMWNLCERKSAAAFSYAVADGAGALIPAARKGWTRINFQQPVEKLNDGISTYTISTGVPLMNSVVNISITMDDADTYVMSFSYNYVGATLMFNAGNAEYIFA